MEIGAGFSTLVALEEMEDNGAGVVHCIEPYPSDFLKRDQRIILHAVRAQDIHPEYLNDILRDNNILFIDSTYRKDRQRLLADLPSLVTGNQAKDLCTCSRCLFAIWDAQGMVIDPANILDRAVFASRLPAGQSEGLGVVWQLP